MFLNEIMIVFLFNSDFLLYKIGKYWNRSTVDKFAAVLHSQRIVLDTWPAVAPSFVVVQVNEPRDRRVCHLRFEPSMRESACADSTFHGGTVNRPVQVTDEKGPEYVFPTEKLRPMSDDSKRQPVVIVGCGCYSPVTYLHLRMFGEILLLVTVSMDMH